MNRAPSVAYEGSGATVADAALLGAALGAAAEGAADGAADPPVPVQAAMNAARLVYPVAARNCRRVTAFADTRRTIASISCSRDVIPFLLLPVDPGPVRLIQRG